MTRAAAIGLTLSLLSGIVQLDETTRTAVQGMRSPVGDRVMRTATEVGRRDILVWGVLGIAAFGGLQGPATARVILVSLASANLVVEGLKRLVHRTRPDGDTNPNNASFPSGHAASAAALAWVLTWRWPRGAIAFWLLAATVSFSRIYLNRHYLSDVVTGVAIGILFAWLTLRLWPGLRQVKPGQP